MEQTHRPAGTAQPLSEQELHAVEKELQLQQALHLRTERGREVQVASSAQPQPPAAEQVAAGLHEESAWVKCDSGQQAQAS